MNRIQVLDCTLRDGGYCNDWNFGSDNIEKIFNGLVNANIDIVECGFLTQKIKYNSNFTLFRQVSDIDEIIPYHPMNTLLVAMINYGDFSIDDIPNCNKTVLDGIRVAFHKKDYVDALHFCNQIEKKGYKVFVQAMVSVSYTDSEFLDLIDAVKEISPFAFYIVDSFGMMKRKDLVKFFYMIEHNLSEDIRVGFHSHNNLQLAYSNAQTLVEIQSGHDLIIDVSIYGMGRGAGNLNTELFVQYLNENYSEKYKVTPLLRIIDEVLGKFYQINSWGYSLSNYLSAIHNIHPNYAKYLEEKKTLPITSMNEIFEMIEKSKRVEYDSLYIERLYHQYMSHGKTQEEHLNELKNEFKGKIILLIAPGKSVVEEKEKILKFIKEKNGVVISINFEYPYLKNDYIFVSNKRRYNELKNKKHCRFIVTSNIQAKDAYLITRYENLLVKEYKVEDNAGLMAIRFLNDIFDVKSIYLAGFDGYSHDMKENYFDIKMNHIVEECIDVINVSMGKALQECLRSYNVHFLTTPRYIKFLTED